MQHTVVHRLMMRNWLDRFAGGKGALKEWWYHFATS